MNREMSPRTSNWLHNESHKATKWTPEENKRFENALALFDKDTHDRWHNVASMIPGKTVNDVIKQYKELVEEVNLIEAGRILIPGYANTSFTLEWASTSNTPPSSNQLYVKRNYLTGCIDHERKKGVPWTEAEHRFNLFQQFLLGLKKYGKGDWRNISHNFVTTRTPTQVASHAQKYFIRQISGGKDKRRSSIHDITLTVDLNDSTKCSSSEKNRAKPPELTIESSVNGSSMLGFGQPMNKDLSSFGMYWHHQDHGTNFKMHIK